MGGEDGRGREEETRRRGTDQGRLGVSMSKALALKFSVAQQGSDGLESTSCAVCMTPLEEGEEDVTTPCGHRFHTQCLRGWAEESVRRSDCLGATVTRCPVCRADCCQHDLTRGTLLQPAEADGVAPGSGSRSARHDVGQKLASCAEVDSVCEAILLERDPAAYCTLPFYMRRDPTVLCTALSLVCEMTTYAIRPRADCAARLCELTMLRMVDLVLECVPFSLARAPHLVERATKLCPMWLSLCDPSARDNEALLLRVMEERAAVRQRADGAEPLPGDQRRLCPSMPQFCVTMYATYRLRCSWRFVTRAVQLEEEALTAASERLRNDKRVALCGLRAGNYRVLSSVSFRLGNSERFFMEVMDVLEGAEAAALCHVYGSALRHFHARVRGSPTCVGRAVRRWPEDLALACPELRKDVATVLAAVSAPSGGRAVRHAHPSAVSREVAWAAVSNDPHAYALLPYRLRKGAALAMLALDGHACWNRRRRRLGLTGRRDSPYRHMSRRLKGSKRVALKAVEGDGVAMRFAPMFLRNDPDVATVALINDDAAVPFFGTRLGFGPGAHRQTSA